MGETLLSAATNATVAASLVRPWSAIMDRPPRGSIANVRTTGVQNMTSVEMDLKFQGSWTDEMFSSAAAASEQGFWISIAGRTTRREACGGGSARAKAGA